MMMIIRLGTERETGMDDEIGTGMVRRSGRRRSLEIKIGKGMERGRRNRIGIGRKCGIRMTDGGMRGIIDVGMIENAIVRTAITNPHVETALRPETLRIPARRRSGYRHLALSLRYTRPLVAHLDHRPRRRSSGRRRRGLKFGRSRGSLTS